MAMFQDILKAVWTGNPLIAPQLFRLMDLTLVIDVAPT